MTPEEKINYALSLVEGSSPGPWRWEGAGLLAPSMDGEAFDDAILRCLGNMTPEQAADSQQIALSPLIPAALRLALAARRTAAALDDGEICNGGCGRLRCDAYGATVFALDAFLALLPEPPKEG